MGRGRERGRQVAAVDGQAGGGEEREEEGPLARGKATHTSAESRTGIRTRPKQKHGVARMQAQGLHCVSSSLTPSPSDIVVCFFTSCNL